jgi:hypothetical protein
MPNSSISNIRLKEVDFGRGLAVFLMILVHTLWMYADKETGSASWLGTVVNFMGKGTAAFLVLMGVSFILTNQQSLKSSFLRGLIILAFAYFMNALKFIVPIELFGTMPEAFINAYGWQSPLDMTQLTYILLTGDILQMAGISFIITGVVRHFFKSKYVYLVLALMIAAVSKVVSGYEPEIVGLNYIARLFFSDHYQVYFPIFPWMSFILFGMFFGRLIEESSSTYITPMTIFGVFSLIVGSALMYIDFEYHFGNFFHLGPGGVLYLLGITLVLYRIIFFITSNSYLKLLTRFFEYLSVRVTSVYIIQWTVICWGMGIWGFQQKSESDVLLLMPIVVLTTLLLQRNKDHILSILSKSLSNSVVNNR